MKIHNHLRLHVWNAIFFQFRNLQSGCVSKSITVLFMAINGTWSSSTTVVFGSGFGGPFFVAPYLVNSGDVFKGSRNPLGTLRASDRSRCGAVCWFQIACATLHSIFLSLSHHLPIKFSMFVPMAPHCVVLRLCCHCQLSDRSAGALSSCTYGEIMRESSKLWMCVFLN